MYESASDAEAAFYEAFEKADLNAMMTVWVDDNEVVCIHPMGPRIEGHAAVQQSWAQIFAGGPGEMKFHISNAVHSESDDLAVHFVYENISFGPGMTERSIVLATNAYRRTDDGWRMISHHGSPGRVGTMQIPEPASGSLH